MIYMVRTALLYSQRDFCDSHELGSQEAAGVCFMAWALFIAVLWFM